MRPLPQMITRTIRFPNGLLEQMREVRRKSGIRLPLIVRKALNAVERNGVVVTPWRTTTTYDDSMGIKVKMSGKFLEWPGWKVVAATNWHMQREREAVASFVVYIPDETEPYTIREMTDKQLPKGE